MIVAVAGYVVSARRSQAPWARSFGFFLKLGLVVIAGLVAGVVPAFPAYRRSLSDGDKTFQRSAKADTDVKPSVPRRRRAAATGHDCARCQGRANRPKWLP